MSKFVQIEVCVNGTITSASARALNRAIRSLPSRSSEGRACTCADCVATGSTTAEHALYMAEHHGLAFTVVAAAGLTGANKARHTREVTRSRKAQVAREARKDAIEYHTADCACGRTEATCTGGLGYEVAV